MKCGNTDVSVSQLNLDVSGGKVLGAGTGAGLGTAPMQLAAARSKGWLAVGIFIQPFMFEGQKRLEQVIIPSGRLVFAMIRYQICVRLWLDTLSRICILGIVMCLFLIL